jgi:hypothetical protein
MLWDALQLRCIVDHLLHQFALVFKIYVSERLTQWHEALANHDSEAATRGTKTSPLVSPLTPVIPLDLKSTSDQSTQNEDVPNRDIESIGNDLSRLSLDEHHEACRQKDSSKNSKVTPQESSAKKSLSKGLPTGRGGTDPISSKSASSPRLQHSPSDANVSSEVDVGSPQPNMLHSAESTNASNAAHRPNLQRETHASGSGGNTNENNLSEAEYGPVTPGSKAVTTSSPGDETSGRQTHVKTHTSESNANTNATRLVRAESSPCTQKSEFFTTGSNGGKPAERHQSGPIEGSGSPKSRSLSSGRGTRSKLALGLYSTPSKEGVPAGRRLFESCPQPARMITISPPLKPIESPSEKMTTRASHRLATKAAGSQGFSGATKLPYASEVFGPQSSPPGIGLVGSPSKPPGTGLFGSLSTPPVTYGLPSGSVKSELFGGASTSSSTSGSAASTQFRGFGSSSSTQSFGFGSGTSTQSAGLGSGASKRSSTSGFGSPQSAASRSSMIPVHRRSSSSRIPLPTSELLPGRSKSDTLPFHQPPEKPETSSHLNDDSETGCTDTG